MALMLDSSVAGGAEKMLDSMESRIVVGFDVRKKATLSSLFMTSYNEAVRYEDIYDEFKDFQNGLNLFFVNPLIIKGLQIKQDAQVVAFDLPNEIVLPLLDGSVSRPHPLPRDGIQEGWCFVGFDVVDPITQASAFHEFLPPPEFQQMINKYGLIFNEHGLIQGIAVAQEVAVAFDSLIPEHAPFSPCGVWLVNPRSE